MQSLQSYRRVDGSAVRASSSRVRCGDAIELHPIACRIAAPIRCVNSLAHEPFKRGIRPLRCRLHESMLHRIEMDVIDMPLHIDFVSDLMFPETALPDRRCSSVLPGSGHRHRIQLAAGIGNVMLDLYPAGREVRVALRERPDAVQVIRHQDHCIGREWKTDTHAFDGMAQRGAYGIVT